MPRAKKRFGFRVEHIQLTKENQERVLRNVSRILRESFPPEWEWNVPVYGDLVRSPNASAASIVPKQR